MDFNTLYRKIQAIDEGTDKLPPSYTELPKTEIPETLENQTPENDDTIEECGGDMEDSHPQQPDNVSMNISMNSTGKNGIRDLMNILKDLESGSDDHQALYGQDEEIIEDNFENEEDSETYPIDSVTDRPSDDLHQPVKHAHYEHPTMESTINKLRTLYSEYQ